MERAISTTAAIEVWRPIAGFEGLYEVSNLGRVRSVPTATVRRGCYGITYTYHKKVRIRKPRVFGDDTNPYIRFFNNGKECQRLVCELVAEAFVPNPDNLPNVKHKDGCKTNNVATNLEWYSPHILNEEWRPVKGFEGYYEVSNQGRVRSLDNYRRVCDVNGVEHMRFVKGVVRKLQLLPNGYVSVSLKSMGKHRRFNVHRLIAETFIPNPHNLPEVNHKDEDKSNNRVDNLEWCDRLYNANYGTGRQRMIMTKSRQIEQLTLDGRHVAYYDSGNEAARMTNYNRTSIHKALNGTQNTAYGYQWRYV